MKELKSRHQISVEISRVLYPQDFFIPKHLSASRFGQVTFLSNMNYAHYQHFNDCFDALLEMKGYSS